MKPAALEGSHVDDVIRQGFSRERGFPQGSNFIGPKIIILFFHNCVYILIHVNHIFQELQNDGSIIKIG